MASFKKTNTKVYTKVGPELTPDNIYWKKYTTPVLVKEYGPINHIDFSPVEPYHFAVTCSVRVQIYNPITKLVTKNLSRFKEAAYGGSFRGDGKLLCAGGQESVVRLFDSTSGGLLRLFAGHGAAVHAARFTADGLRLVSFSDDKSVSLWDIAAEKMLTSFAEHTDYVRCGACSPISPDVFVSGSYDRSIRVYDARNEKSIMRVDHEAPVESVVFLPSGGVFLSAGGTEIRVWDALAGGKLLAKISQHHKTITCLRIASNGRRILSGSLDRHVKIYDAGTYRTVHSLDYPNSVLSLGISADDETIAVGMVDGLLSIRRREDEPRESKISRKPVSSRYSGRNLHASSADLIVAEDQKRLMSKHDNYLRKFHYSKALDSVMMNYVVNKTPHVTVALMQELVRRQGLRQALAGREGKSLVNILKFLIRHAGNPRFGRIVIHVANVLMDVYEDNLDELSAEPRAMFNLLEKKLVEEEELVVSLLELQGTIHMLLSASETCRPIAIREPPSLEPSSAARKSLVLSIT